MNRRSFLTGLIAAPAIIRPGILMPVSVWKEPIARIVTLHDFPVPNSRTMFFTHHSVEELIEGAELSLDRPLADHEREHLTWFFRSGRDEAGWGFPCRTIEKAHLRPLALPVDAPEQTCA